MRKKGFAKYLLTWLLALLMVLGSFTAGTVPVQAAETESDGSGSETAFANTYQLQFYERYAATGTYYDITYSSDYVLFLYCDGTYSDGSKAYKIGCFYNGSIYEYSKLFTSLDLDKDGYRDINILSAYYCILKSDGSLDYDKKSTYDNPYAYLSTLLQFRISSDTDFVTSFIVFNSSSDAGNYYLSGDTSGVLKNPDLIVSPDEDDDEQSWKQIILDTVETWFGGTLEVIAIPLQAVAEGIGTVSTKIIELRDHLIEQLPSGIGNALRGFFDVLDSSILDVFSLLQKFHNFCVSKSAEFISYFSSIVSSIDTLNRSIIDKLVELTPEEFKEAWREHVNTIVGSFDWLKEVVVSLNDRVGSGFDTLSNLATNFSSYVTKFFDFASVFLEFSVDNPVTQIIFEALRRFLEPMEQLFVDLFVPDKTLIETEFAALREKLGFIDDLQTAGVYLLNFFKNLGSGTPPVININLGASRYRDLGNQVITLDFSWYAEYKPTVDKLLAGIIWATFIWNMYKRLPDIIQGAGMISAGSAKIENDILSRSDKSGGHK